MDDRASIDRETRWHRELVCDPPEQHRARDVTSAPRTSKRAEEAGGTERVEVCSCRGLLDIGHGAVIRPSYLTSVIRIPERERGAIRNSRTLAHARQSGPHEPVRLLSESECANLASLGLQVGADKGSHVRPWIEFATEALEGRVVRRLMRSPPLFERAKFGTLEAAAVHRERREYPRRSAISVLERMDRREGDVDPSALERGVRHPFVHVLAERLHQFGDAFLRRGVLEFARCAVHNKAPLAVTPRTAASGEDAMLDPFDELRRPLKDGVVGASLNVSHRLAITLHERGVDRGHGLWAVTREDASDLFDGDPHAFH